MRPANTTLVTLASEIVRSVVGFFVTLYLARALGASVLGTFFVVIAAIAWIRLPINAIGSALTKRVSEGTSPGSYLGAGALLYSVLTVAIGGAVLLARDVVDAYVGAPVSVLMVVLLVANCTFSYVTCALDGQKRVASSSLLKAGENVAEGGAQIALVLIGYELVALIAGQFAALLIGTVAGLLLFRFRPSIPGRTEIARLVQYARYSWLGAASSRTFGWMDTIVLSLFVGSGLIGVYEISWRLASALVLLNNAIQRTIFPEISELAVDGNESKVRFLLDEAIFYGGLTAIPGLFGAAVLGERVLRIYGGEFTAGATVLLILVFARLVEGYGKLLLTVVNGLDRPDIAFRINGAFVASNLGLNLSLVYLFGWHGAAVATAISASVTAVLSLYAVRQLVGDLQLPVVGVGKQVLASAVMAIGLHLLRAVVPITNMYYTVGYVLLGVVAYGLVLVFISQRVRTKLVSM